MAEHKPCIPATPAFHNESSPHVASSPSFQLNTPLCPKCFYWPQFKFRKKLIGRINYLQNQISLVVLI